MTTPVHILNGSSLVGFAELDLLRAGVRTVFGAPVELGPPRVDLNDAYDSSRGQYNSTALLARLLEDLPSGRRKSVLLVDVDLFIPVLTFVFGEAQFGGAAAVVSTHRLANQFYGLPGDHDLLIERLGKELIHEVGHTFGLYHCRQFECVMRSSTYVEEIDMKRASLCGACRSVIASLPARQGAGSLPA